MSTTFGIKENKETFCKAGNLQKYVTLAELIPAGCERSEAPGCRYSLPPGAVRFASTLSQKK
jgi:hypothetical protein